MKDAACGKRRATQKASPREGARPCFWTEWKRGKPRYAWTRARWMGDELCVCVCVCVCSKKRTGTRLRSGPLPPATFLAYTQPGPPSKDDGGRTADGEAEHAAWKTSDDYGQKGIYVSLCLLLGKKANNFCVSPLWGDTRMPLSESHLIVF